MDGADINSNNNNGNYDPFDPFSEKEDTFDTKKIRRSKASQLKRSIFKPAHAPIEQKKKKNSLFSRLKTFFKELPERRDKKRIYFKLALIPTLIFVIGISLNFLINYINHNLKIEETKAEIESAHTDFFLGKLNEEEDLENYKLEIEEKYNSTDDPDLKFLYRNELIRLHIDNKEKNKEVIGWINEQLSYKKISTIDKVNLLVNLIALYRDNGMTNGLNNALNELMNIPDDGEMAFEGETLTELKTRIKNENS